MEIKYLSGVDVREPVGDGRIVNERWYVEGFFFLNWDRDSKYFNTKEEVCNHINPEPKSEPEIKYYKVDCK